MVKELMESQEAESAVPTNKESISKWAWSFWKPTITAGAVLTLSAGAMVLTYLRRIDRIDLLQHALASKDGLTLVVVMAIVLSVTLFICLFASALITHSAASIYTSHSDISAKMPFFLTLVQLLWVIVMFSMVYSGSEPLKKIELCRWISKNYGIVICVFIVISSIAGGIIQASDRKLGPRTEFPQREWILSMVKKFSLGSFVGLMFTAGALFSAFAAWAFFVMNPEIGKQEINLITSLMSVGTAIPGIMISNYLFRSYCRTGDMRRSQRESVVGSIMVSAFVCITIPQLTLYPIDMHALSAAGIYSTSKSTYLIKSKDDRLNFKSAGFDIKFPDDNVAVIDGYVRFHLGSLIVLCSDPYDPLISDQASTVEGNLASVRRGDERGVLQGGCLDTSDNDVKRIVLKRSTEQDDKNKNGSEENHGSRVAVTNKKQSV